MKSSALLIALPVVMLALAGSSCYAQSSGTASNTDAVSAENMHGFRVKEIHPPSTPTPFPLGVPSRTLQALEFRSPEAMTAADRAVVDADEAEITRRADLQGLGVGKESPVGGKWGYEQAVCPALPQHVLLEYSRDNGRGDVTLFGVALPRGEGHVRVIPVRRRSYSLFTPASSNALTINDFNHIVKEEPAGLDPDWFTLGLCYSALAGGHVRAALQVSNPTEEHYPLQFPAQLMVSGHGGAEVHFADTTPEVRKMDWVLNFAQDGRLLKVKHKDSHELKEVLAKGQQVDAQGVPAKGQIVDVNKAGN
ncbi:hypothetical protein [Acidicapsa ligni]|uniref:hypothetical protein n=1 Tax=Acidicapsa ligni TaxID=542300 RepID=UPI0021DFF57D|nr:hypothetical protein [Acidicapsa ligni]